VADQINPWVGDGGNYFHYGFAFAFQWALDFPAGYARIEQAEANLQEVMALDKKALGGVGAQVEEAYAEAEDWQNRLAAYREAEKYAKQWLATVQQAIEVGTMQKKDLIDPSKAWAEHRYNVLNAIMQFNLALAKLAQVTGWDAIAPGG
jgi:outer membrane protein TolC